MAKLRLEITTPHELAFSEEVDMVVLPAADGEIGIYPQHVPLMTQLKVGELRIIRDGQEVPFAVGEGFVEVTFDAVNVLTDMAVEEDTINEEEVEKAIERAQKALEKGGTDEEVAAVEASLQRSLAKLNLKRRTRR